MGINLDGGNENVTNKAQGVPAGTNTQPVNEVNTGAKGLVNNYLTFGQSINLMSSTRGSEFTNTLSGKIEEIYTNKFKGDNVIANYKLKVIPFDNNIIPDLAYSAIVVALQDGKTVFYYTILLGATGTAPLTASGMVSEMKQFIASNGRQRPNIFTPDDANDSYLHNILRPTIARVYNTADNYIPVDGAVLGMDESDVNDIAYILANSAINAIYVASVIDNPEAKHFKDLNLTIARQESNGNLRYNTQILTNQAKADTNAFGAPVRDDWVLDLKLVSNNSNIQSLNKKNSESILTKVAGFIETGITYDTAIINGIQQRLPNFTLQPNIIISSMSLLSPTPGYVLLGILSGVVMANPNMYLAALRHHNPKTQVGNLNVFTDILNEKQPGNNNIVPSKIDLSSKKLAMDEIVNTLRTMYKGLPTISIDVPAFGPETSYLSFLSLAASPRNGNDERGARLLLIEAARELTNNNFDPNFNPAEVFNSQGIVVPLGTWVDKNGIRDIRDIDLAFIAGHTDDNELLNLWIKSNLPSNVGGVDPFNTKVDIISKLVPDAKITGKAIRITFSAKFINELSRAAMAAGLDVNYEPEIKFMNNSDLSGIGGFFSNAGIGATAYGFANEFVVNSPTFNTQYVNSGLYRY